jgi:hypothetical protein
MNEEVIEGRTGVGLIEALPIHLTGVSYYNHENPQSGLMIAEYVLKWQI